MRYCVLCYQPDPALHKEIARRRRNRTNAQLVRWLQKSYSLPVFEDDLKRHLAHHDPFIVATRPKDKPLNAKSKAILALLARAQLLTASQIEKLLYGKLQGAAAQTACSRDLRRLREQGLIQRSVLPKGKVLEMGNKIVGKASCYSLKGNSILASTGRYRKRSDEWTWNAQQVMLEANEAFLHLRFGALSGRAVDIPLGGWVSHVKMQFTDTVTRRKVSWHLHGVGALVDTSTSAFESWPFLYLFDDESDSAQRYITSQLAPWRSLSLKGESLQEKIQGLTSPAPLLIVSRTPQRSRDLKEAARDFTLLAQSENVAFCDFDSLPFAFTHPVVHVLRTAAPVTAKEALTKSPSKAWNAQDWQLILEPKAR